MPNHFHLVVQPATDAALSLFIQWWMTSHVCAIISNTEAVGMWQGRSNQEFSDSARRTSPYHSPLFPSQSSPRWLSRARHGLALVKPSISETPIERLQ